MMICVILKRFKSRTGAINDTYASIYSIIVVSLRPQLVPSEKYPNIDTARPAAFGAIIGGRATLNE